MALPFRSHRSGPRHGDPDVEQMIDDDDEARRDVENAQTDDPEAGVAEEDAPEGVGPFSERFVNGPL